MKHIARSTLAYAVLGPVFGTLLAMCIGLFGTAGEPQTSESAPIGIGAVIQSLPIFFLIGLPIGFWFGGLQAAFVGLIAGVVRVRWHNSTIWAPVLASVVAWFAFVAWAVQLETNQGPEGFLKNNTLVWLAMHVLPSICVWAVLRWRRFV